MILSYFYLIKSIISGVNQTEYEQGNYSEENSHEEHQKCHKKLISD